MLLPGHDFLVAACYHRSSLRVAQVTTGPLNHVAGLGIAVLAVRTLEAPFGRVKVPFVATLKTFINRCISAQIADPVIGEVPDGFQSLRILNHIRVLAVVDKAA